MNALALSPVKMKNYEVKCSTVEDLFFKCQPDISTKFENYDLENKPNIICQLAESMANYIDEKHVS